MIRFRKARNDTNGRRKKKTRAQYDALHRLNEFLDEECPELVRFLVRTWQDEENAITYHELRDMIIAGALTAAAFEAWRQDYAVFYNRHLKERYDRAANVGAVGASAAASSSTGRTWIYDPMPAAVENWVAAHGAEWVTKMTDEQREAMQSLIGYAAKGNMTVDELSRAIRPLVGLNEPQARANLRYYEKNKERIKKDLLSKHPNMKEKTAEKQAERRARDMATRYAARQHRQRAQMIAETELAFAYNKGADDAIHQAMDEGYLPRMQRVWSTAADELVCDICGALEGTVVDFGETFDFKGRTLYEGHKETPPAHPRCRCALCYEEVT